MRFILFLNLLFAVNLCYSQVILSKQEFDEFTYGNLSTSGHCFRDLQQKVVELELKGIINYDNIKAQQTISLILRLNDTILLKDVHLKKFTNLKHLFIWGSNKIPECIFEIYTLEFLAINPNKFNTEIPDKFDKLYNLKGIQFQSYSIKTFPKSILKLTNLKSIYFDHSGLDNGLPDDFYKLTSLERLSLSNCETKNLKALSKMKNLKFLKYEQSILSDNKNKNNPEIVELFKIENLVHLSLNYNESIELAGISKLEKLTSLYIYGKNISNEIFQLKNLEYLSFKDEDIIKLPSQITNLKKLYGLEIWCCKKLTDGFNLINQLKELRYLNLIKLDLLSELPSFKSLTNLNCIIIKENPKLITPQTINGIKVQTY